MRLILSFLMAIQLISAVLTAQSVPALINYQGHLTDAAGAALPTSDYSLTFRIFDDPVAGNLVWGPLHFDIPAGQPLSTGHKYQVPVVNGYFNVMLGDLDAHEDPPGTSAPRSILNAFNDAARYVEITIDEAGGGLPILPRQQILSAPFAIRAKHGVPTGTIVMWSGSLASIPDGWALCDGNNGTPDLRGRFALGADAGEEPGASGGTVTHRHHVPQNYLSYGAWPKMKWQTPILMSDQEVIFWVNWNAYREPDNGADTIPTHVQLQGNIDTNSVGTLPVYLKVVFIIKL